MAYSSGCKNISRHQRLSFGERLDQVWYTEDQIFRCSVLSWLTIDMGLHAESLLQLFFWNGNWSLNEAISIAEVLRLSLLHTIGQKVSGLFPI